MEGGRGGGGRGVFVRCQSNPSFLLEVSGLTAGSNRQTVSAAGTLDLLNRVSIVLISSEKGCIVS